MSPVRKASSVPGLRNAMQAPAPGPAGTAVPVRTAVAEPVPDVPMRKRPPARPVKPVRITIDLDPGMHQALKRFAADAGAAEALVIRALLRRLGADKDLAGQVRAIIWEAQARARRPLL